MTFTRRTAISLLGSASVGTWLLAKESLAPGAPASAERMALIDSFRKRSAGLEKKFEAHSHKSDWLMPYRLFRPASREKLPLVLYLHGSGGLGDDNEKQLSLGNIFGTLSWVLPENQQRFPCYVLAPQTDRGWIRYKEDTAAGVARPIAGFGDGAKLALEIVDDVRRKFAVDERRIYVAGQSMGGAGVWNMLTFRPRFFAAAVICCGSASPDDGSGSPRTPLWNFHGAADQTVAVSISRDRIATRRKAGGRPIYTEYAGVDHNVWQWAFTEPGLFRWVFSQARSGAATSV
jgi:predicted peptidase